MAKKQRSDKHFPELPEYPGGKQAFLDFIRENMHYPEEAFKQHIEGDVLVKFQVNENGDVIDAGVQKGIGYGCDEEAIRLVKMARFGKTHNRGFKLSVRKKVKIRFRLKNISGKLSYSYTPKAVTDQNDKQTTEKADKPQVYEYTVTMSKK
ncbi:MAG: energy transducer TonB [Bacteroidia bacterium]|nr:energy transducer TonB [Bacteroidales bacterium]NCD41564.1 energy transducer TonB [Bacteroidia bacterium]MDD2322335.1 energy transducer TonB [Bacteroidales bacterium]MDD3009879.1 energy transducer TonB [Bacteroidales bacterium]MDD3961474.1 energy transducer TonB [Bacteroidales bacterium]